MEKKTGCRRRIVIKEDFIFVGVCGHVTGAWWAPWGPGLSIFRFRCRPSPWQKFSSCRNMSGIQFKMLGVYLVDIRLPNQASYQAGVEWADDPHSTVTTCAHKWGPGSGTSGYYNQRKGKASQLTPPPNYFLFWLVGFQTTCKGWLGYKSKHKKTLQPYESGIDGAILQWLARVVLPRVLRFPPTKKN